jgi:hypothetical protein
MFLRGISEWASQIDTIFLIVRNLTDTILNDANLPDTILTDLKKDFTSCH